jgi:3-phenylpropionate/trans-cinnamate dioxygenase ferredoxin reductase component
MMQGAIHLVVGAGLAGASAAMAMREAGFEGRIVILGEESEPPYDRPPLSKDLLTAAEPKLPHLHPASRYAERAVEVMTASRVEEIDLKAGRVRTLDGRSLPYDRLLLATGGRARRLTVPGGESALYLRSMEDALRLRGLLGAAPRVALIGAGVIGLEIASSARARGCGVVVLETLAGAMRRVFTPEIAEFAENLHRSEGVELRFRTGVEAIERVAHGQRILCAGGEVVEADLVVAGIGMERAVELALAAGIAVEGGILVDEFGRTSAADVFAAGDVARFWSPRYGERRSVEHWRHALDHGTAVGRAMCGPAPPYDEIPWFWTDQHGVNFQTGGAPLAAERTVLRGSVAARRFTAFHLSGERLVGVTTVNDGRNMRPGMALIRAGGPVDAEALADEGRSLRDILRAAG